MERKWRAMGLLLFGVILSSAPAQDRSLPTALVVSFPDAPNPWKTCSGPRTIKVTAVYSSGQAFPYNGVGRAQSPSDPKCNVNGMEIPIVNGVGALPNSVVWYKHGENIVQVSTKDGALKGEAKATIVPQEKDIKLEIEKPEPKPGYVWAGSVFKVRIKATANGKPVDDVILRALDSKGVMVSPQTLVTDQNGLVNCELFTPNFLCPTTPNGNGTLEGDARLSAKFFLDVDGDNAIDDGEPGDGFDEIPIAEPCPQELIPCALELCRILAEGGVFVAGPALGPTPASVATEVTRKPDQEKAERAILRDACRFLEDQVIGFINSGKWNGRFSEVVKRLEHLVKFLRPIERARPVIDRLQCAADILKKNPDVKDVRLNIENKPGKARVLVGSTTKVLAQLFGHGSQLQLLPSSRFHKCTQPAVPEATTVGPGSVGSIEPRALSYDYTCTGRGDVVLTTRVEFTPETGIIVDGAGEVAARSILKGSLEVTPSLEDFPMDDTVTVAQFLSAAIELDVDANGQITDPPDGIKKYLPGEKRANADDVIGGKMLNTGDKKFNKTAFKPQEMKLIVTELPEEVKSVVFKIEKVTSREGYCSNKSDKSIEAANNNEDYSFDKDKNERTPKAVPVKDGVAVIPLFCKDYGGTCVVSATPVPKPKDLEIPSVRIPRDNNQDEIADAWQELQAKLWKEQYGEDKDRFFFTLEAGKSDAEKVDPDKEGEGLLPHNARDSFGVGDGLDVLAEYRGMPGNLKCGANSEF
jgi:hypothetical protein